MTTFYIKVNYLKSVEIILEALYLSENPDAEAIADGIQRTLVTIEDGVPTHIGGVDITSSTEVPVTSEEPAPPAIGVPNDRRPSFRLVKGGNYDK